MAIRLEFIDLVVPIEMIRRKYPGGWEACLREHDPLIGHRVWYDAHLFRDGAMSPQDAESLVESWAARGFEPFSDEGDTRAWKDLCIVEVMFGGPTLPCEWLEVNTRDAVAHLRGTEPGPAVGREEMQGDPRTRS